MAKSFKEEEFYARSKAEWKYVAFVLDHCLLNIFIGMTHRQDNLKQLTVYRYI